MMGNEACTWGMAGMGLVGALIVMALVLGVAALVKYLFFNKQHEK